MPGGGVLIDTPGLRALGLTGSEEGISSAFPDIEQLSRSCRFRDCTHVDEPGCAVQAAVASGELEPQRLASYHKLVGEAQDFATRMNVRLRAEDKGKAKAVSKDLKDHYKRTGRD
jgi:ribosome biogenesis GTPase